MSLPPVSVVIVSRGRPDALRLCLTGAAQLCYPGFELIVVADPAGNSAAQSLPFGGALKCVAFDKANISAARNAGIDHAAGEIVAFLDDDAVPEPTWLTHLIGPFADADVAATGGYVRGRNGISFQWQGRRVDRMGQLAPLPLGSDLPRVFFPAKGTAIKTEGTNMAVRRSALVALGGFDPAYHFFLDETDLNLRLAAEGFATALVPLAQVHHGYAASPRRRADRVPLDLSEIGASWAVFQRRFVPEPARRAHWQGIRSGERARALRLMQAGLIEPRDVRRLMKGLDRGYAAGSSRPLGRGAVTAQAKTPFAATQGTPGRHVAITARSWQAEKARAAARAAVKNGSVVTLLLMSPTSLYHRARFHPDGYWEQAGGVFGKSERSDPLFRVWRFGRRAARELARIGAVRGAVTREQGGE